MISIMLHYRLVTGSLERNSAEKDQRLMVGKLNRSEHSKLAKKANSLYGCIRKNTASRS